MPFISAPLGDAKEPEAVPEGNYDLRIVKSEDGESKKGNPMTTVYIRIEDPAYPNAALVGHWIMHVTADLPADQLQMRILEQRRFLECFGIPYEANGFNTDDLLGATGNSYLIQEVGDDNITRNRLRLPKLKDA